MRLVIAAVSLFATLALGLESESPRSMNLEIKLGPVTPLIDRGFTNGKHPWEEFYGGTPMLLGELELDFQFFQKVGSLAVGVGLGYGEKFAHALDEITGARVDVATGFRMVPIEALLVYRFDWLAINKGIPLVPYVKGAFVAIPWWELKGSDIEKDANGRAAEGIKYGVGFTGGMSLVLDFLEPRLARDFDNSMGVNHTYLFAEYTAREVFVGSGGLDLSSRHWMIGLAFEF